MILLKFDDRGLECSRRPIFLTYDSVITTCTLKSPVFTPATLVYLDMGVQI